MSYRPNRCWTAKTAGEMWAYRSNFKQLLNPGITVALRTLFEGRFAFEQVMIVLGEAVGFVAHVLQQTERVSVTAEP